MALFPGALPMTERFADDVIWETQVRDISHYSGQLNNAPVEAIFDAFHMPEIHPMDEEVKRSRVWDR